MKMDIEAVGGRVGPLERIHISTVLGSINCGFDRSLERARVEISHTRTEGVRDVRCRIELQSDRGSICFEGVGDSATSAFMRASEGLDRALFDHFFRDTGSNPTESTLAA